MLAGACVGGGVWQERSRGRTITGYLVLTKGEASWARRGRFANILAVDDHVSFGRSELGGVGW